MARQDGYKYEGVAVENFKIDDDPAKTKALEANGANVKTRQPKKPRLIKLKVAAAILAAVIILIVVLTIVLVFASRDNVKPVFSNCPRTITTTVHSASEAENISATWEAPVATDDSGRVNITSNRRSGDLFTRGSTTNVTYRAVDPSGNQAECIFQVSVVDCELDEWRCDDGTCILDSLVCDGTPTCADESDQSLCEDCLEEDFLFPCDEGTKCLPISFECDGVQHCDDFEDERYCDDCEANGFLPCQIRSRCYRHSDACNDVIDCPRFRDEYNCYECASIAVSQCQSLLPYNVTFFPSIFKTPEEAIDYYMDFSSIMDCHQDLELFLCSYLFPECAKPGHPRYLCRDFCQEVEDACKTPYANANGGWELNLYCGRYPGPAGANSKLCPSTFEGCDIAVPTAVDISNGTTYDLYSPNYPMSYPSAFDCRWQFHAAEGKYIVFELIDLSVYDDSVFLGSGLEVDLDMVTYYYRNEVRYGRWLLNITIDSDAAWLQMVTKRSNEARGFHFKVWQVDAGNETCGDDEFLCDVGGCLKETRLCDGFADCYNEKDELECDVCPYYDMVKCSDGSCIHRAAVCDGYPDCNNDEDNCTFSCHESSSSVYLNDMLVCDSFNDCGNHADELLNCDCVEGRQFDCGERCIPINYLCDGTYDCADGSDEMNCTCPNWKRPCDNGACLPFWFFCDNSADCSDGSDEIDCPPCPGNYFECDNLECISGDGICDGYFDCSDRSDEAYCLDAFFECPADSFMCPIEKQCVPEQGICDGIVNCKGGEDEEDCDKDVPPQGEACGERVIELTEASPNFTLSFPVVPGLAAQCLWFITSPPATRISATKNEKYRIWDRVKAGNGHDPTDSGENLETYNLPLDKAVLSRNNTMWVDFQTDVTFLAFKIHFRALEKVCPENQKQCLSKYDDCIMASNWCDQKPDCSTATDEQQCLRLENLRDATQRREGLVMVTIEGDEKYLCYDDQSWSERVGDVICNEYGYGYMNDSSFVDVTTLGPITDGYYVLSEKSAAKFTAPGPKPVLYTIVEYSEDCPSQKVIRITCEEQECGKQGHMPRVVSGRDVLPGEVPWMVSLSHPRGDNIDHYCGGALISSKWVITAGHCVSGYVDPKILAGTINLTSNDGYEQVRQSKRSILFPNYINYNDNDIALLELEVPVVISDRVRPVCLPLRNDSQLTEVGSSAHMAGWGGAVPFGSTPLILQTARATIIDTVNCKNFEDRSYVNEKVVCCMNQYGEQNSCKGDSGGPLYVSDAGTWYQIGLVSRGGTPSCSAPRQVVVYTRLAQFLDFIEKYVRG